MLRQIVCFVTIEGGRYRWTHHDIKKLIFCKKIPLRSGKTITRRIIIITNETNIGQQKIMVVDSIMGAGKSSWAIQHINENPYENTLFITPFLSEVDRIISSTNRKFKQPVNRGSGKLASLNELLSIEADIVATHELFRHLDQNSKQLIKDGHYTLFLDEALNVVEPYELRNNDLQILLDSGCITIDENGYVLWDEAKKEYDSKYNSIKLMAQNKSLVLVNKKLLVWKYPQEIFNLFDKVYVLTYLFEGNILKYYFDLHSIAYEKKSVQNINGVYSLTDYFRPDTEKIKDRICIYQGNLNENFYQKRNGLSRTWFNAHTNRKNIAQLRNNLSNYFRNILHAKSDNIMWTVFKDYKSYLRGRGYTNGFTACNLRATNDFADRHCLAYMLNVFLHPAVSQFFKKNNISVDEEAYALSEMIQWIWRSAIRNGEDINIYIPSMRMRGLLSDWLNMSFENQNQITA